MTKIKQIHVTNLKAITEQTLNLNGATAVIIAGNNKGKTTLLRSLKDRLLKLKSDSLVRAGETDGLYEMTFTDGTTISWELTTKTRSGEKLTMISKDGSKTSVITDIIKWFAPANFDIDKFLGESPAAQRKTLEKLLGLDFTTLDLRYTKAVEERKDANRDVERIEVNYKGKEVDETLPVVPTPTEELQKELLGVEAHNRSYNLLVEEEERLTVRQKALQEELDKLNTRLSELDVELSKPEIQPRTQEFIEVVQNDLRVLTEKNVRIEENNTLRTSLSELTALRETAHAKDISVKDILREKDNLIRQAKMPEGFGFTEEGVTYNGFELSKEIQSPSALYIAALKLASIQVGNVRFLHFDASFLDKNSLKEVLDWAHGEDLQLLLERPDFEAGDIRYELIEEENNDDWL